MNGFVHYGLTRRWALEAGFDPQSAEVIARANIGVDRELPGRQWRNKRYHFAWLGARRIGETWFGEAMTSADLVLLGRALHCVQDAISHGNLGHLVHWPGIDLWERRGARVQQRIERASRDMLVSFREAHGALAEGAPADDSAQSSRGEPPQDIL